MGRRKTPGVFIASLPQQRQPTRGNFRQDDGGEYLSMTGTLWCVNCRNHIQNDKASGVVFYKQ